MRPVASEADGSSLIVLTKFLDLILNGGDLVAICYLHSPYRFCDCCCTAGLASTGHLQIEVLRSYIIYAPDRFVPLTYLMQKIA